MRGVTVWKRLGVDDRTVIEGLEWDHDADALVAHVRPRRPTKRSCGRCGRPAAGYDRGQGRRRLRGCRFSPHIAYTSDDIIVEQALVAAGLGVSLRSITADFVLALAARSTGIPALVGSSSAGGGGHENEGWVSVEGAVGLVVGRCRVGSGGGSRDRPAPGDGSDDEDAAGR